jgi:hypothetical protein
MRVASDRGLLYKTRGRRHHRFRARRAPAARHQESSCERHWRSLIALFDGKLK